MLGRHDRQVIRKYQIFYVAIFCDIERNVFCVIIIPIDLFIYIYVLVWKNTIYIQSCKIW